MQWPEAWEALDESDGFKASTEQALLREVGPGHLLYGVPVQAIARSFAADDVLYRLLDGSGRVADVHLTWAQGQERLPWPHTVLYHSLKAWLAYQEKETDLEW